MKAYEIIDILENKYPLSLQCDWDHSGIQCGHKNQEVQKIMIALDCDLRTIKEAIHQHCDMLITHHPFLFKSLNLDLNSYVGQCIELAIKNNLVIYSSHTPLDQVSMNNWLAEEIGLTHIHSCEESQIVKCGDYEQPLSFDSFIKKIKEAYKIDHVQVAGNKRDIKTVAICGGSGAEFFNEVECDAYLTGDLKYHSGEEATIYNRLLINIGHHVEVIMVSHLHHVLKDLPVEIVESCSPDYFQWY